MGILNRNFHEEGFYEEDEYGDLTKLDSLEEIERSAKSGNLYHHDGYSMEKMSEIPEDSKIEKIIFYNKYI
jgi:hypothetical protein